MSRHTTSFPLFLLQYFSNLSARPLLSLAQGYTSLSASSTLLLPQLSALRANVSLKSGYFGLLRTAIAATPRLIKITATATCLLIVAYFACLAISSFSKGFSWEEMDWQQKGKTTLSDFFAASDVGKREVRRENKKCFEYYAYKDGLSVKTVCPD